MYILRNLKNKDANPGRALPGDIIIGTDFRKTYLVGPDHSHRRLIGEQHTEAVDRAKKELIEAPSRKVRQDSIREAIRRKIENG